MSEVIKKIKTERDKFKDMYQNVHNEYSIIKNQIVDIDKKNEESNEKLIKYKKRNLRLESEVRQIVKSIDCKKMTLQNICSDTIIEKMGHLSTNQDNIKLSSNALL